MTALATDLARRLDAVQLARAVGIEPDQWQLDFLRSTARRTALCTCRQSGKTTVCGILATHTAVYTPGSTVIALSASERQGMELLRVVRATYRTLGRPVETESESRLALQLENGSRVVVLPSASGSIRGYAAVELLIVDEAARVDDETFAAASPMLAVSNGRLIIASTPWARRGFFFEAWHSRTDDWARFGVTAADVPRISPAFLERERLAMGAADYAREYLCTFGDLRSSVFRGEDVERMSDPEVIPWAM